MRKIIAILLTASIAVGCKYNTEPSQADLKDRLKKTMNDFLYKGVKYDSSQVKFNVIDVTYFDGPDTYACEFKVRMRQRSLDTIGIMSARISKDFFKVDRRY